MRTMLAEPPRRTGRGDAAVRAGVEKVLLERMWIRPSEVRVRADRGAVTLTGAVGRRTTAAIAARLAAAVPGVTTVTDRIRYDFDDRSLARSRAGRTHPFSAEPFPPTARASRA